MNRETFQRREIERAFRKFGDLVQDIKNSTHNTWDDALARLLHHCQNDAVMQVITEPLLNNTRIDFEGWLAKATESVVGTTGSGRYQLPSDDEDCTALLYQFLLKANKNEVDVLSFCVGMYGSRDLNAAVDDFNREIVGKFVRELAYRLNEVGQDIGSAQEVSRKMMIVFQHHDHSTTIHGSVNAGIVATGDASVSDSTGTYNSNEDLSAALKALKPLIHEVVVSQRDAVQDAIETLVKSAEGNAITAEDVVKAARTIDSQSPTIAKRIKELLGKVALSIGSSTIVLCLKSVFGRP